MKEQPFRRKVIEYLESLKNTYVVKVEGLSRGTSDLIVNCNGRFVAIELKGSDNKYYDLTEPQKVFLKKQQDIGGIAFVLRHSKGWEQELLDYLRGNKKQEFKLINWDAL